MTEDARETKEDVVEGGKKEKESVQRERQQMSGNFLVLHRASWGRCDKAIFSITI